MLNKKLNNMRYLFFIIVLAIAGSCTKLEPKMYSDLTTGNAYSTEKDINAALVGVYSDLRPGASDSYLYRAGYIVTLTDYGCDMGYTTYGGDIHKMGLSTYDPHNHYFSSNWGNIYKTISDANVLISKIEDVSMDETKKKQVIGQARFLRALAYFDVTNAFGPVPLLTEMTDPTGTYNMPLSPVSEVDVVIIEDCKYAVNNLLDQWPPDGIARATKGAAATLLGKVYLRAHDYTNAKTYIDMVLQLRNEGVYVLNSDFKNVFSDSNPADMGMIFGILHESSINGGEIVNHFCASDNPEVPNRWGYYAVSLEFWRNYDDADPRKHFFYYNYEGMLSGMKPPPMASII